MKNMITSEKILLVDDEEIIRGFLKVLLSDYNIVLAKDGQDALEKFKENDIFMVITDYKMPKMDGIELLKSIKELDPKIPIYLLTAFGGRDIVESTKNPSFDGYFDKPMDEENVLQVVESVFNRRKENMISEMRDVNNSSLLKEIEQNEINSIEKSLKLLNEKIESLSESDGREMAIAVSDIAKQIDLIKKHKNS